MSAIDRLSFLLADIHQLYIKTLAYHWNIEDPRFSELHVFFEEGYTELAKHLDEVAERIRMLGEFAPGSVEQLSKLSRLSDTLHVVDGQEMIELLVADYEYLIGWISEDIEESDIGTADLLTAILRDYEKRTWMLRAHLS